MLCSFAAFGSAFESPQGPTGKDNPNNNPNRKSATTKSTAPAKRSRPSASNSGSKTAADEIAFWNSIKDSTDPADFKAYLEQYPNGKFVTLAKNHLARLEAAQPKATSTPAPSSSPSPSPVDSVSPSQPACSAPPPAQPSGRPHTVNL
ncbi:MAG TPA: hypothetical protein VKD91_07560, partial [Pyrinomonadaceae bacterium]|nr:hypothetical protein [Pyrinomonadaceae bacterium]